MGKEALCALSRPSDDFLHMGQVSPPTGVQHVGRHRGKLNASCMPLYETYYSSFFVSWDTHFLRFPVPIKFLHGQCKSGLAMSCSRLAWRIFKEREREINPKLSSLCSGTLCSFYFTFNWIYVQCTQPFDTWGHIQSLLSSLGSADCKLRQFIKTPWHFIKMPLFPVAHDILLNNCLRKI